MDTLITNYLYRLNLGQIHTFRNMAVLPLFSSLNGSPKYIILKEAIKKRLIAITELNNTGSVPELKVSNSSEKLVLLLDGEELIGAKQNRVLNTSILLNKKSETIIPVSCTEQGRWSYTSAEFTDSETLMSPSGRSSKLRHVTSSLMMGHGHLSDQGQVWTDVAGMHKAAGTSSPTGAMRDLYTARSNELNDYLQAFRCDPRQQGSLIFINGHVAGLDIMSRQDVYKAMHPKLIESYAVDALLHNTAPIAKPTIKKSILFLQETLKCTENRFDAVSLGCDYRFEGSDMVGSALVYADQVIHMSFFKATENGANGPGDGYSHRRRFI